MSSTLQQAPQNRARLRAASASTLPLSLDLRNQYRGIGSTGAASPANAGGVSTAGGTPRPPAISTAGASPYGSAYTTSFPSAPLTAPIDFALPRTATTTGGGLRTDYSMPQMSAPLNPPADFSQASQSFGSAARTPMRDTFSAAGTYGQSTPTAATATSTTPGTDPSHQQPYGNHHIHSQNQQQQQSHSHHHNPRPEDYGSDALGSASLQRKHSFTTAPITPVSGVGTQAYGSTA